MAPELWTRRGVILAPGDGHRWWRTHAQTPTPLVLGPRHWRIFFAARNERNQSRMIFADVDPQDDMRVLNIHDEPLLDLGKPGTFDTAGQGVSMVLRHGDAIQIYYVGMHLRPDVSMGMSVGLAQSHDDGLTFERLTEGPVLACNAVDPYFCSMIYVEPLGGAALRGWYMTGTGWETREGAVADPVYGIRAGYSQDNGMSWRAGTTSIGLDEGTFPGPVGLARPWVAPVQGERRLWFSYREREHFRSQEASAYRIMHVPLDEGAEITGRPRTLEFANPPSSDSWDGFMQAYPVVMPYEGGYVVFYNGNGFGQTGFGWATLGV